MTHGRFGVGGGRPEHWDADDLTLTQAARLVGRSVGTIRHAIKHGHLPARRETSAITANFGREIAVVRRADVLALWPPDVTQGEDLAELAARVSALDAEVARLRGEVDDVRRLLVRRLADDA